MISFETIFIFIEEHGTIRLSPSWYYWPVLDPLGIGGGGGGGSGVCDLIRTIDYLDRDWKRIMCTPINSSICVIAEDRLL